MKNYSVGKELDYQYMKIAGRSFHYISAVKPVLRGHSKRRPKLVFKADYRLMQVKSIVECSKRAFCNTFYLH